MSRYKLPAKVGICQVIQSFIGSTSAVSGYNDYMGHVIESSLLKNRDKQMTFIVRVSICVKFEIINSERRKNGNLYDKIVLLR